MSCTRYMPPNSDECFNEKKIAEYVKGHTALGGGNMALFGTGCLHTWARSLEELVSRFTDDKKIDRRSLFDDSANRLRPFWIFKICFVITVTSKVRKKN